MEKEIHRLLAIGGISRRYCCHGYFTKCVLQALKNPLSIQNIRRDVYLPVAQELGKDIRAIEHGVRHARDLFVNNGGTKLLAEIIEIFVFYLLEREEAMNQEKETD